MFAYYFFENKRFFKAKIYQLIINIKRLKIYIILEIYIKFIMSLLNNITIIIGNINENVKRTNKLYHIFVVF